MKIDRAVENFYDQKLKKAQAGMAQILGVTSSVSEEVAPAPKPPATTNEKFHHGGHNKEYFLCQTCGEPFWRREPDPRYLQAAGDDPATCPACGAKEGDFIINPETGKPMLTAAGNPMLAVFKIKHSVQREAWNKQWAQRRKQLPIRTAQGQHVRVPANFIRDTFPQLTMVQRSLVIVLALLTDSKAGFAAVGTRTLAMYCKPVNRSGPLDNRTIREALRGMEEIKVKVWRESSQATEEVPLLQSQKMGRAPTRYWLRMGD